MLCSVVFGSGVFDWLNIGSGARGVKSAVVENLVGFLFVVLGTGLRLPAAVGCMAGTETGASRFDSAGTSMEPDPLIARDPWAHANGTPVTYAPPFGPPAPEGGSQCPIPPPWQTDGGPVHIPLTTGQASEQSWQCVVSETLPVAVRTEPAVWNPQAVPFQSPSLSGAAGSTISMEWDTLLHHLGFHLWDHILVIHLALTNHMCLFPLFREVVEVHQVFLFVEGAVFRIPHIPVNGGRIFGEFLTFLSDKYHRVGTGLNHHRRPSLQDLKVKGRSQSLRKTMKALESLRKKTQRRPMKRTLEARERMGSERKRVWVPLPAAAQRRLVLRSPHPETKVVTPRPTLRPSVRC